MQGRRLLGILRSSRSLSRRITPIIKSSHPALYEYGQNTYSQPLLLKFHHRHKSPRPQTTYRCPSSRRQIRTEYFAISDMMSFLPCTVCRSIQWSILGLTSAAVIIGLFWIYRASSALVKVSQDWKHAKEWTEGKRDRIQAWFKGKKDGLKGMKSRLFSRGIHTESGSIGDRNVEKVGYKSGVRDKTYSCMEREKGIESSR